MIGDGERFRAALARFEADPEAPRRAAALAYRIGLKKYGRWGLRWRRYWWRVRDWFRP